MPDDPAGGLAGRVADGWYHRGVGAAARLFGPIFESEFRRLVRGPLLFRLRAGYPAVLWLILVFGTGPDIPPRHLARVAEGFVRLFLELQFFGLALLTPMLTAGVLADVKRPGRVEFLLTTHLTDFEIVVGGLIARLLAVGMVGVAGTPVFALLMLLGGILPSLVAVSLAVTGVTVLSLAGLGAVCSLYARKPEHAVWLTYLFAGVYLAVAGGLDAVLAANPAWGPVAVQLPWVGPVSGDDLAGAVTAGDPFVALQTVWQSSATPNLTAVVERYLWFHGLAAAAGLVIAVWRFRPMALRELVPARAAVRRRSLPPVSDRPVLWRELHLEGRVPAAPLVWTVGAGLAALSFWPLSDRPVWDPYLERLYISRWVHWVGSLVQVAVLCWVMYRASGTVSKERERQTLDLVLVTPLEDREIRMQKWWAALLSTRWLIAWLVTVWLVGLVGGANLWGIVYLALLFVVALTWAARIGILSSCQAPTQTAALARVVGPGMLLVFVAVSVHGCCGGASLVVYHYPAPAEVETLQQISGWLCLGLQAVPLYGLIKLAVDGVYWPSLAGRIREPSLRAFVLPRHLEDPGESS